MKFKKHISLRKNSSWINQLELPHISLQKSKTYYQCQFKRKFSYAYFDLLCSQANILNQKITESSDDDHLPSCCNGLIETIDQNNHIESGHIGIIYVHYDSFQKTRFDHLNIRNIFESDSNFYIDFGLDVLEKYWLKSDQPLLFVFSHPQTKQHLSSTYKIHLSGILLDAYFEKNKINQDYISTLKSKNINHLTLKISPHDSSQNLTVTFLKSIQAFKNKKLVLTNKYFSQQKIHDENQQIGRFGEQFVKYRCFEYGFLVRHKTYDFGIDFIFYSFNENRQLEEKIAHLQIKSQRKSDIKNGYVHKSIKTKDIQTWINYLGPVFLIVVDVSTSTIYWTFIKDSMAQTNPHTTVKIPITNILDETGLKKITTLKNKFS